MEKKARDLTHEVMKAPPSLRTLLPDFKVNLSVDTNVGKSWVNASKKACSLFVCD